MPPPTAARDDRAAASFLLTFRNSPEMRLVRAFDDASSSPARPFLDASLALGIRANAEGWNSRGVAIDDTRRARCEADCAGADACLADCAEQGVDVFVANRSPATLLVGTTPGSAEGVSTDDLPRFFDAVPVALGASRVVIGDVIGLDGRPARRVFVVCFDSRQIFVYDPRAHRVESVIRTGRGPQALAVDDIHGHGYVAHFTDSYLGVVDLDQRSPTYGEMVLTIGQPTPPRASK
ncbi:MAG: hypothetical protein FJW96_15220 [Actinobacteria bacterium]|nr:hypothetical protein [Actinomycetota bacterium]